MACGGLTTAICHDFTSATAKCELHVLGLFGKMFTGPWMKLFYTSSATSQITHIEGIGVAKAAVTKLKLLEGDAVSLLTSTHDLLGGMLDVGSDTTLQKLRHQPDDVGKFAEMMKAVMAAAATVLGRQYKTYFNTDLTAKLAEETRSARSHNIDAEEIMGMFSALKMKSPNATICFMSSKIRSIKNGTVDYLDEMAAERQEAVIRFAIKHGRKTRTMKRRQQSAINDELAKRIANKKQKKETRDRKKIEKMLKTADVDEVINHFNIEEKRDDLTDILQGNIVGRSVCHVWSDDGQKVVYNGKVTKLRTTSRNYVVAYWAKNEAFSDAVDYTMPIHELAADLIEGDLELC